MSCSHLNIHSDPLIITCSVGITSDACSCSDMLQVNIVNPEISISICQYLKVYPFSAELQKYVVVGIGSVRDGSYYLHVNFVSKKEVNFSNNPCHMFDYSQTLSKHGFKKSAK